LNFNYKPDPRYIANPLDHLYHDNDVEISERPEIQELYEEALDLSDKIPGDFDLEFLTFKIRHDQLAFARIGLIASHIKFKKLYKKTHSTFDRYCRDKLGVSYWQIDDTIKATDVVMELIANGFDVLPKNVSQGEKLAHIRGSERVIMWQGIIETYKPHEITAEKIEEFIAKQQEKVLPKDTPTYKIEISEELYCFLWALGRFVFDIRGVTEFLSALFETSKKLGNSLSLEMIHYSMDRLYQERNSEVNTE
jgi:hypothetical protein